MISYRSTTSFGNHGAVQRGQRSRHCVFVFNAGKYGVITWYVSIAYSIVPTRWCYLRRSVSKQVEKAWTRRPKMVEEVDLSIGQDLSQRKKGKHERYARLVKRSREIGRRLCRWYCVDAMSVVSSIWWQKLQQPRDWM